MHKLHTKIQLQSVKKSVDYNNSKGRHRIKPIGCNNIYIGQTRIIINQEKLCIEFKNLLKVKVLSGVFRDGKMFLFLFFFCLDGVV